MRNDYSYGDRDRIETAPSQLEKRKSPRLTERRVTRNDPPVISKEWQKRWNNKKE